METSPDEEWLEKTLDCESSRLMVCHKRVHLEGWSTPLGAAVLALEAISIRLA